MTAVAEDLALALELADLADAITIERFGAADLVIDTKPDLTPVTEADTAAERAVRERVAAVRPGDAVVGEEFGTPAQPRDEVRARLGPARERHLEPGVAEQPGQVLLRGTLVPGRVDGVEADQPLEHSGRVHGRSSYGRCGSSTATTTC